MQGALQRNHVNVLGSGEQTVVFGHGFGCDQTIWRQMLPFFEERYRVVLYDYVGAGQSDRSSYDPRRYSSLDGYARDLLEILDALDGGPFLFVGHSVSSMIGLLASVQKPEAFQALVMICPSARYRNDPPGYFGGFSDRDIDELLGMMEMNFAGWATANAAAFLDAADRPRLSAPLEESFRAADPEITREFAAATFLSDCRGALPAAAVPSLMIQCAQDSVVPIEAARYLHEHTKSSVLTVLDAKGHYPHLSRPQETAEIVLQYLDGFAPVRPTDKG